MPRPRKPKVGTIDRLRKDLAANWPVYDFVEKQLRASGRGRGAITAALNAAADKFGISDKTARRRWQRIAANVPKNAEMARVGLEPTHQSLLPTLLIYLPDMQAATDEIDRAFAGAGFTASEQREWSTVSITIARKIAAVIAAQRIEIERLRRHPRRRKRK